jgi:hypothetical protein
MVRVSFIAYTSIFDNYDILIIFCLQKLIDVIVDFFNNIVAKDGIVLNMGGLDGPDSLPAYLKK